MDGQNNFEQQFTQNLQTSMATVPSAMQNNNNRLQLVITVALAAIVLFESIALLITLVNYPSSNDNSVYNESESEEVESEEVEFVDNTFFYDDNDNLIAINLKCTSDDGASMVFANDNTFKQYDQNTTMVESTKYSIHDTKIIEILNPINSDSPKVLYFDGMEIADGLKIYKCSSTEDDS